MGAATRDPERRWKGGIIPFVIHSQMTNVKTLREAIREIEKLTNLRFVQRVGEPQPEDDFIEFRNGQSPCHSPLGRVGKGKQPIFCVPGGSVAGFMHEIGHAIGLIHEHQRSDRNNFVTIQFNNVKPDPNIKSNFDLKPDSLNSNQYDFRSLMHYREDAFTHNGNPTIVPRTPGTGLDHSTTYTASDRAFINSLYPNLGVVRRSDSSTDPERTGDAREIATVSLGKSDLVTAIVDSSDAHKLLLLRWRVDASGGITRIADTHLEPAGRVSSISIAEGGGRLVTACRSSTGHLLLISWSTDDNALKRLRDSGTQAGDAMQVHIIRLTDRLFVTACRTDDKHNRLLLIAWRLDSDGSLHRLPGKSDTQAGEASDIAMTTIGTSPSGGHLVATAVRTTSGSGRVRVIIWDVHNDGSIDRLGDSGDQLGEASQLALVRALGKNHNLVLSGRSEHNELLLLTLSVSTNGQTVGRIADSHGLAGEIQRHALVARPYGALSATADSLGNLFLIKWRIDQEGRISRFGDSGDRQAGRAQMVNAVGISNDNAPVITPVRSGSNTLFLVSWDDLSSHGELTL